MIYLHTNFFILYYITTLGSMDTPHIRRFLQHVSPHQAIKSYLKFFYIHLYSSATTRIPALASVYVFKYSILVA
jgi:hypothetical protein